jgi:hypothetical protein
MEYVHMTCIVNRNIRERLMQVLCGVGDEPMLPVSGAVLGAMAMDVPTLMFSESDSEAVGGSRGLVVTAANLGAVLKRPELLLDDQLDMSRMSCLSHGSGHFGALVPIGSVSVVVDASILGKQGHVGFVAASDLTGNPAYEEMTMQEALLHAANNRAEMLKVEKGQQGALAEGHACTQAMTST